MMSEDISQPVKSVGFSDDESASEDSEPELETVKAYEMA